MRSNDFVIFVKTHLALVVVAGFVLGIIFGYLDFHVSFLVVVLLVLISLYVLKVAKRKVLFLLFIGLVAVGLGDLRYENSQRSFERQFSSQVVVGDEGEYEARIVGYPDVRTAYVRYIVEISDTTEESPKLKSRIRVEVYAEKEPLFHFGDLVSVVGKVQDPYNKSQNSEYNHGAYLRKDNVRFQMFYPDIVLKQKADISVRKILYDTKNSFLYKISLVLPEPQSALGGGLLLGADAGLGDALKEAFRKTGLTHIVVLSGYNLALVAYFVFYLAKPLRKSRQILIASVFVFLFVIMTGAEPATTRAGIMILLFLFVKYIRRPAVAGRLLIYAGAIMILINPVILFLDVGFQLSFMATLGLIYLTPLVENRLGFVRYKPARDLVSATISTQIAVAPILLHLTGEISWIAIPVNLLVLPLVPFSMLAVSVSASLAYLSSFVAMFPAALAYILLQAILIIVKVFSSIPHILIVTDQIGTRTVFVMYAVIAIIFVVWTRFYDKKGSHNISRMSFDVLNFAEEKHEQNGTGDEKKENKIT